LKVACEKNHSSIVDYLLDNFSFKCESIKPKSSGPSSPLSLWYSNPSSQWLESLPIGNGYMGGMISGGYPREMIQLNSDTLWSGCPHDYANPGAFNYLEQIRQLIENDKWIDAQSMIDQHFFGNPMGQASYQPVGNVFIDFFEDSSSISILNYLRELNLEKSLTTTSYSTSNGINYQRTCFASYPDNSIIYQIQTSVIKK
jgi:alpha-L-fucosidase 2